MSTDEVRFKILEKYEGQPLSLETLAAAVSLRYLWIELILNEDLVRRLRADGVLLDHVAKATSWYHACRSEVPLNAELEGIPPQRLSRREIDVEILSFRKVLRHARSLRIISE